MDMKEATEEDHTQYRTSLGSRSASESEALAYELDNLTSDQALLALESSQPPRWWNGFSRTRSHRRHGSRSSFQNVYTPRRRRLLHTRLFRLLALTPYAILIALVICGLFFPSYTNPPRQYSDLRNRVQSAGQSANINNEKIFIAASLYDHDGELLSGEWGRAVLRLIDILGHDNVFLSIYENDPDDKARAALDDFASRLRCQSAIITEHLDLSQYPHVVTMDGRHLLKRMAFLADVRNRALRPLQDDSSSAHSTRFDKLLYLNDVIFDPIDAANLLFSTNMDESTGRANYRAACAVDFINPIKFYDTFATRDLEGYDMGVPFYPWFTNAGRAESRRDVLEQKDAVRVKSCWGGMVAFEAKWFQPYHDNPTSSSPPVTEEHALPPAVSTDLSARSTSTNASLAFRSETDTYWDASECCLIHADLTTMDPSSLGPGETGIYMNPYIRVAYSASVHPWLSFTRRFERLYTLIHRVVNWIGDRPSFNPRQSHEPGQEVVDRVWIWDSATTEALIAGTVIAADQLHGRFEQVHRTALPGSFCGMRRLFYINENPAAGEAKWGFDKVPPADR